MSYHIYFPTTSEEQIDDIFYGQIALIGARWFLIAGGLLLTLWGAKDVGEIQGRIYPLIFLIAMNFYLHGRYLMERPAGRHLIYLATLADLLIISLVILVGIPGGRFGVENPFFIFYYPTLLSFTLVFAREISFSGMVLTCLLYGGVCLLQGLGPDGDVTLLVRLVTLVTTGLVGTLYWRIQRERRRAAQQARGALLKELDQSTSP